MKSVFALNELTSFVNSKSTLSWPYLELQV